MIEPSAPHVNHPRKADFNYGINGFRGVCVLLVFVYHVAHSGLAGTPADSGLAGVLNFFLSSFRYGVELFFMISGYVILKSLERHATIGAFLRDRVLRIFPAWVPVHLGICVVGMTLGLKAFAGMDVGERVAVFFANLFLLPPIVPLPVTHDASWSLSYEWIFYLLASLAVLISRWRGGRWLATIGWGLLAVLVVCALPRALFFIPGVLVAVAEKQGRLRPAHATNGESAWLRWPLLSALIFLVSWRLVDIDMAHPWAYTLARTFGGMNGLCAIVALLAGLHLFASVSQRPASRQWVLRSAPLQFLGTISYSFYLWHPVVMFPVKRAVIAWVLQPYGTAPALAVFTIVSLVLATAVSYASYQLFETRLAKSIRAWGARRRTYRHRVPVEELRDAGHV